MPSESIVSLRTLDGLHLAGTFVSPDAAAGQQPGPGLASRTVTTGAAVADLPPA
jgi:hypothetical protein